MKLRKKRIVEIATEEKEAPKKKRSLILSRPKPKADDDDKSSVRPIRKAVIKRQPEIVENIAIESVKISAGEKQEVAVNVELTGDPVKYNQEQRRKFLTDEQLSWIAGHWTEFLKKHAYTPSDEMEEDVLNQVNYGRVYLRLYKEGQARIQAYGQKESEAYDAQLEEQKKRATVPRRATPGEEIAAIIKDNELREQIVEVIDTATQITEDPSVSSSTALRQASKKVARRRVEDIQVIDDAAQHDLLASGTLSEAELKSAADFEGTPTEKMWQIAWSLAQTNEQSEWHRLGFTLRSMVEYCRESIEAGEPEFQMPFKIEDIFWSRPRIIDEDKEAWKRRWEWTSKIYMYLTNKRAKQGEQDKYGETKDSYRVALAANRLASLLERYASNFRHVGTNLFVPDDDLIAQIKLAAKTLYEAYCPIPKELIKPGPIPMVDPDFMTYQQLCQQFKIVPGTLLHEIIQ